MEGKQNQLGSVTETRQEHWPTTIAVGWLPAVLVDHQPHPLKWDQIRRAWQKMQRHCVDCRMQVCPTPLLCEMAKRLAKWRGCFVQWESGGGGVASECQHLF